MTDPTAADSPSLGLPLDRRRAAQLILIGLTTVLAIPLHRHIAGAIAGFGALAIILRDPLPAVRRRLGVLLGCVAILAATDINTSTDPLNFLQVGIPFALVILLPALILGRTDPGVIRYRFWPRVRRPADVIYTVLSVPLAWAVLQIYWWLTPTLHLQWTLTPGAADSGEIRRLFLGINLVGIWDELFFVNTAFAILRSLFHFRAANALQAVIYTSVLFDMAFVGAGPVIVFLFAWTQGSMFEKSEGLVWVLAVHLIVDYFLVAAILEHYYPGIGFGFLWRHGW